MKSTQQNLTQTKRFNGMKKLSKALLFASTLATAFGANAGFQVSGITEWRTGLPFSAFTGTDSNRDSQFTDKPIINGVPLLRNSFRFRLHNTSYRGLRFSFRGTVGEAYVTFLLFGILTLGTLYLLAPMFHHRMKAYQHGYSWFGRTPFRFDAGIGAFYRVYLLVGLVFIGQHVLNTWTSVTGG